MLTCFHCVFEPDVITYYAAIGACVKEGCLEMALQLLEKRKTWGTPDIVIVSMILQQSQQSRFSACSCSFALTLIRFRIRLYLSCTMKLYDLFYIFP